MLFLIVGNRNNLNSSSLNLRMAFRSHQPNNDYPMPDDEHEIILDGLKYNSNIDNSYQIRIGSIPIHHLVGYYGLSWSSWR
jgi:hypothetical protein